MSGKQYQHSLVLLLQTAGGIVQVEALGAYDWQAEVPSGSQHLCGCTPSWGHG